MIWPAQCSPFAFATRSQLGRQKNSPLPSSCLRLHQNRNTHGAGVGARRPSQIPVQFSVAVRRAKQTTRARTGLIMGHIQTELKDDVLRITIDRPEKKNALTTAMYTALAEAVEQAEANPDVRVLLLHGNGDSFTAGNDLEDFVANPWKGQTVPPALRFIAAVVGAKKPIIAAVHGMAVGIGVTILLHCDLVYAADNATLVMPFVNLG